MCPSSVVGPPLDLQRLEEENLRIKTVRFIDTNLLKSCPDERFSIYWILVSITPQGDFETELKF